MKIHYISDHSILEYDEVQMFLDMGHEVFSNGAYLDPKGHITLPRPGLVGAKYYEEFVNLAVNSSRTDMPRELIDPFDVIIVMHSPNVIVQNWAKLRNKPVVYRSIGQSTSRIENLLKPAREDGLKIVRYSPKESNIPGFIGSDALIRFYKNENEYKNWNGSSKNVVNFSQSLKGRREFCHYDEIINVIEHFDGTVYGPGNEDLGKFNGGQVPYEKQIEIMRYSRCMVYGGTWPASYTLSFIEALMMGLPIVAISKAMAHYPNFEQINFYEVDELLAQIGGIVCDTPEQMVYETQRLIDSPQHAKVISKKQRALAIELFSKEVISSEWGKFLDELV